MRLDTSYPKCVFADHDTWTTAFSMHHERWVEEKGLVDLVGPPVLQLLQTTPVFYVNVIVLLHQAHKSGYAEATAIIVLVVLFHVPASPSQLAVVHHAVRSFKLANKGGNSGIGA